MGGYNVNKKKGKESKAIHTLNELIRAGRKNMFNCKMNTPELTNQTARPDNQTDSTTLTDHL